MMLTISKRGELVIESNYQKLPLSINSLEDIHEAMEKYQVDFISPSLDRIDLYVSDKHLATILNQFNYQRLQFKLANIIFKKPLLA